MFLLWRCSCATLFQLGIPRFTASVQVAPPRAAQALLVAVEGFLEEGQRLGVCGGVLRGGRRGVAAVRAAGMLQHRSSDWSTLEWWFGNVQ